MFVIRRHDRWGDLLQRRRRGSMDEDCRGNSAHLQRGTLHEIEVGRIYKTRGVTDGELEQIGYIIRQKFGRSKLIKLTPKFFEYFDLPPEKLKEKFQDFSAIAKAIEDKEEEASSIESSYKAKVMLKDALKTPERELILRVLAEVRWNRSEAAKRLGIHRSTLYHKIRQLRINTSST